MLIGLQRLVGFTACWKWCRMGALGHGIVHLLVAGAACIGFVWDLPHAWLGAPRLAWVGVIWLGLCSTSGQPMLGCLAQ